MLFLGLGPGWGAQPNPGKTGEHAVFLLDTSINEHPDRFRAHLQQLGKTLEKDTSIKHFNVLTFDIAGRWLEPKAWLENTAAERDRTKKSLENVLLEGATDFAAALDSLAKPAFAVPKSAPLRIFLLSDGNITWGPTDARYLTDRFERKRSFPVRFVGDLSEPAQQSKELFKALAALSTGGKAPQSPARDAFLRFLDQVDPKVKLLDGKNGEHVKQLLKMLPDNCFDWPTFLGDGKIRRLSDTSEKYLKARATDGAKSAVYLDEAKRRADSGDPAGAVRALSSVAELHAGNADALRLIGYRLLDLKQPAAAARLFDRVQRHRPFEPHSYRDLARSLEDAGKFGLAAIQYEIVLAGTWNAKFTTSLKEVVLEEYAHMMRHAIRQKTLANKLADHFGDRIEGVGANKLQADLRVTITWNTDDTDVDLWVIEPDGTKCFYAHRQTKNGGELTQDVTQGYGPERYQMIKAGPGEYTIKVHYYSGPRNPQIAETHVNVVVRRNAGTPQEVSQRFTVILRNKNDLVEVCRMKF
jgi:hypothetical protein